MTTPDVAIINPEQMHGQMEYAKAISSSLLLPKAYQGQPASILIAIGLGQAIGITPAQALYEVYVVNGRPSPSANLVAALVRRSGHKVRVKGDEQSCTAQLIRADDPDYTYEVTWTIEQARRAGLTNKDTWKSYPANMLRSRAVMDVCRAGAPEAMLGMEYSREEMQDIEAARTVEPTSGGMAALRDRMARSTTATSSMPDNRVVDVVEGSPVVETGEAITGAQRRALFAAFKDAGFDTDARTEEGRSARLAYMSQVLQHEVESTNDLTSHEASVLLDALREDALALASSDAP